MLKLIRIPLVALAVSLFAPGALATGPEVFVEQGCNKCHSATGVGIQRTTPHDEEAADLSKVGAQRDKRWIAQFLLKKIDREGDKHKKQFQGTTEQLKTVAEWLESLK